MAECGPNEQVLEKLMQNLRLAEKKHLGQLRQGKALLPPDEFDDIQITPVNLTYSSEIMLVLKVKVTRLLEVPQPEQFGVVIMGDLSAHCQGLMKS